MAKVNLTQMKLDASYINGMEHGVNLVKDVFSMTVGERKIVFGESDVAKILDKFDFIQIKNRVETPFP